MLTTELDRLSGNAALRAFSKAELPSSIVPTNPPPASVFCLPSTSLSSHPPQHAPHPTSDVPYGCSKTLSRITAAPFSPAAPLAAAAAEYLWHVRRAERAGRAPHGAATAVCSALRL